MTANTSREEFESIDAAALEIRRLREYVKRLESDTRRATSQQAVNKEAQKDDPFFLYSGLLLAHTPNMIFLFNEEFKFVIGSTACHKLTRRDHPDLKGYPLPEIFTPDVDKLWVDKIFRFHREVSVSGITMVFNDSIEIEGEETAQAHITISPLIDRNGRKRGTIMAINDIVELVNAQRQAEEAAAARTRFLANISHEIRTPMNAIKGLSELLAVTSLTDPQRVYVENIISSSNALVSLINDVLDFSSIDAQRIDIVPERYKLGTMIADLCGIMALRAEEKGLSLFLHIDPNLPTEMLGDDNRIKQVLLNLLSNAVKYTKFGSVTFSVSGQLQDDGSLPLHFKVKDTGIGIRAEDIPVLFTAFSRVDVRTNRSIQGTGLGLAISKNLAEAMKGNISLQSEYGTGTTFSFTIPQQVTDPQPLAYVDIPTSISVLVIASGMRAENAIAILKSLKVGCSLFMDVEDDETLAKILSDPDVTRSRISDFGKPFTHCLYTEAVPQRELSGLRRYMSGCSFGLMRSVINNMDRGDSTDSMLFNPLKITELADFLNKPQHSSSGRFLTVSQTAAERLRVKDAVALVVDDNRINLMVCEKMLDIFGMAVRTALNGPEALELCRNHRFDVIFVDHMMPGMDGLQVTEEIRSHEWPNTNTPIVALTANVVSEMRKQYLKSGMDDFISKPIDRKELSRVLLNWLPPEKIADT